MRVRDADPIPELKRAAAKTLVSALKKWRAHDAAVMIGTDEPRVKELRRGDLRRFSLETLIRFLVRASCDVELRATPRIRGRACAWPRRDRAKG